MAFSSCEHARDCVLGVWGSAYLPSACLASCGLQGMVGPVHGLCCLLQPPPPALEGRLGESWPATHLIGLSQGVPLSFAKLGVSSPPHPPALLHKVLERSFPLLFSEAVGALLS